MAEEQDRETTLRWLREPPGAGEVRVFIERGEGAEISDEARQALEQLMDELNDAEVAGYMAPTIGLAPSLNIFAASIQLDYGMCGKKKKCS